MFSEQHDRFVFDHHDSSLPLDHSMTWSPLTYSSEKCSESHFGQYEIHLSVIHCGKMHDDVVIVETDLFFDCMEYPKDHYEFIQDQDGRSNEKNLPTISEIWLMAHRKTTFFRRCINYLSRSKTIDLTDLADDFARFYGGAFEYPIGYQFRLCHRKEKWLFVLKRLEYTNASISVHPQTRILMIRKGIPYLTR